MSTVTLAHNDSSETASAASSEQPSSALMVLAKAGYGARGVIYLLVGGLALLAAFGYEEGGTGGSSDALKALLGATGGWVILAAIALGLVGYSAWRFTQALADTDRHGTDAKGLAVRGGLFVSAITHLGLAAYAGYLAYTFGQRASDQSGASTSESFSAWLLGQPFGRWALAVVGLCIAGAGIAHMIKAFKEKYEKWFDCDAETLKRIRPVCKFGLFARGVVFVIVAGFFLYAAWTHNAEQAGGLGQALDTIRQQTYGTVLMIVTAAGLMAFGVYSLLEARYRRITAPP